MKTVEEILAEIKNLYNKNPLGWQISINRDPQNYGNILVFNKNFNSLWQIKLDSLYRPNSLGLGAKIKDIELKDKINKLNLPNFGYRPLLDEQLKNLQSKIMEKKPIDKIIIDILSNDPVPMKNIESEIALEGPVTFSPPGYISSKQKELDLKLKHDLDRLKYKRGLGLQYI